MFRCLVLLLIIGVSAHGEQHEFGGTFHELMPQQKQLVVKIVQRFNSSTGQSLTPEQTYNRARISVRSTFEAVTQALATTELTSKSGKASGNALQLVDVIEDVAGELPGKRGDQQFRIYAVMKPDTIERLQDSIEFFRDNDNSRYHKGFPVCFRMPNVPSIQISLTRDGRRADIDVDYRSPKFPQALVNGHLRASNSDVRVGNNGDRHNQRWNGLSLWWKTLFGFDFSVAGKENLSQNATGIPTSPRVTSKESLDTAVQDFLTSWLLENKPRFAVPYFSRRSYPCLEALSESKGKPVPPGVVRYEILNDLVKYADELGEVKNLKDVVSPVKLWDPAFRPFKNKYESEFTVFAVSSDVALRDECSGSPPPDEGKKTKPKYGEYFGTAFRLIDRGVNEGTWYLLWTRQYQHWQIVNLRYVEVEDPDLSASTKSEPPEVKSEILTVPGDKEANQNISEFLKAWLLRDDLKAAVSFVSPAAYACFDEPFKPEQAQQAFVTGLAQVRKTLGRHKVLSDYLKPFVPDDATFRLVSHPDQNAFAIFSPPQYAAESLLCANRDKPYNPPEAQPSAQDYGRYYATAFEAKVPEGEAAALYTVWAREKDAWKMVAWRLIVP